MQQGSSQTYEATGAMSFKGISESDAQQLLEANLFSRLDTDGDNQLNTQELKDGQAGNLLGFKGHVLNGKEWNTVSNELFGGENISREAFEQQQEVFIPASKESFEAYNRFIQIDTDGDGQLNIEEIKNAQASNLLGFKGAMVPDAIRDSVGAQLAEKNIVITQEYFSQNPELFKAPSKEVFDQYTHTQQSNAAALDGFDPGYVEEPLNPFDHPPLDATTQFRMYDGTVVFSEQEAIERGNLFNRLDTDGDGRLNTPELLAGQQGQLISLGGEPGEGSQWQALVDQFGETGITAEVFSWDRTNSGDTILN